MDDSYDPPPRFETAIGMLHDLVAQEVGASDFGGDEYLPGLKVLLQSMDYDPHFTDRGRRYAWGIVVGVLKGRAQAFKSMRDNPGFDAHAISAPVVITGIPRTGTTALHKLLAVDTRFQGLQTWLLDAPMPRPPAERWSDYPQFHKTMEALEKRYRDAPNKRAAHHMAAEEVDECCLVMRQSFVSNLWSCGWSAPTYDAWRQSQSEQEAYKHLYRAMQLIGMHEPKKQWLLKNPGHIENLDLLFATFPGAKVIQTHRDPAKAVPSLVSLLMQLHPIMEDLDRYELRARIMMARETAKWSNAVHKAARFAADHPGQVLDVVHGDFHRDPMAIVERIYRFIGISLDDATRTAMMRRAKEKPELAHGVHRYDITEFGMTEDEVRAPFGEYIANFGLN